MSSTDELIANNARYAAGFAGRPRFSQQLMLRPSIIPRNPPFPKLPQRGFGAGRRPARIDEATAT